MQRQLKKEDDPFKIDVSRNSFEKFAAKYFQHGYDSKHTTSEIIRPLLDLKSGVDQKVDSSLFCSLIYLLFVILGSSSHISNDYEIYG